MLLVVSIEDDAFMILGSAFEVEPDCCCCCCASCCNCGEGLELGVTVKEEEEEGGTEVDGVVVVVAGVDEAEGPSLTTRRILPSSSMSDMVSAAIALAEGS